MQLQPTLPPSWILQQYFFVTIILFLFSKKRLFNAGFIVYLFLHNLIVNCVTSAIHPSINEYPEFIKLLSLGFFPKITDLEIGNAYGGFKIKRFPD